MLIFDSIVATIVTIMVADIKFRSLNLLGLRRSTVVAPGYPI